MKIGFKVYPRVLLAVCNGIMWSGNFPLVWKKAPAVFVYKPGGGEIILCLLNACGKLLEQLLLARFNNGFDDFWAISNYFIRYVCFVLSYL